MWLTGRVIEASRGGGAAQKVEVHFPFPLGLAGAKPAIPAPCRVEPLVYFSSAASPGQPGPTDTPRPTHKAAAAAINAAAAVAAADAAAAAGESATSAEDLVGGLGGIV